MSYLIRVSLPDTPGSLGLLAEALGTVGGNIQSVDIVHAFADHTVVDDIVVTLPSGALPDALISTAQALDGVTVDSLRPFSGSVDRRGQIDMLAQVATQRRTPNRALESLTAVIPQTMTCGWALVIDAARGAERVSSSPAAPGDTGVRVDVSIPKARCLTEELDPWLPEAWSMLGTTLAATPIDGTSYVLVVGRPGGPDFLDSEVAHLANLGLIIGAMLNGG